MVAANSVAAIDPHTDHQDIDGLSAVIRALERKTTSTS
jgi:hypothetical protein